MAESLGSRYVLDEPLGRGAMGQVFAGSIRSNGEQVAIKVLRPELVSDPEIVARFVQERTILMSIADPNVVRVIDLVVEGETLAIVMELVRGSDLRRVLRTRGTVPPSEALRLTGQMLHGMAAVHAAGIVHRDIKPENVLVDTAGGAPRLKLTDFGVSRLSYGSSLTKLSGVIGTPEYMAPELAEHDRATPAADIYSVGVVLYELLCGRTPFAGGHPLAVLRRHADQAPPVIPGVPGDLWDRIAWMLAKDPRSRPASAQEAFGELAPLESALAALPALDPWTGPEAGTTGPATGTGTAAPGGWATTMSSPGAGRFSPPGHGEPPPGGTVLRHRDRGDQVPPGGFGGPAGPAGDGHLAARQQRLAAAPSRSKRQPRLAVLAVAVVVILGLGTAVALAATHRASSTQAASVRSTTAKSSTSPSALAASPGNAGGRAATATAAATASGGGLAGSGSSGGVSGGSAGSGSTGSGSGGVSSTGGGSGTGGSSTGGSSSTGRGTNTGGSSTGGGTNTGGGTSTSGGSSTGGGTSTGGSSSSLSTAEQKLESELNAADFYDCSARTDLETGVTTAALNCTESDPILALRPLAESFPSGDAETWFQDHTSGFSSSTDCVGGHLLGSWTRNGVTAGQLGCSVVTGGYLRVVWVVGSEVGFIAEGTDATAVFNWWKTVACALPSAC